MGDDIWARLAEDVVVGHSEAETAAQVDEIKAAFGGEVGEGYFAMDGNFGSDVVFVNCLETRAVQLAGLLAYAY